MNVEVLFLLYFLQKHLSLEIDAILFPRIFRNDEIKMRAACLYGGSED